MIWIPILDYLIKIQCDIYQPSNDFCCIIENLLSRHARKMNGGSHDTTRVWIFDTWTLTNVESAFCPPDFKASYSATGFPINNFLLTVVLYFGRWAAVINRTPCHVLFYFIFLRQLVHYLMVVKESFKQQHLFSSFRPCVNLLNIIQPSPLMLFQQIIRLLPLIFKEICSFSGQWKKCKCNRRISASPCNACVLPNGNTFHLLFMIF